MAIFRMAPEYWNIFSIFRTVLVVIWLVWTFKICTGKSPIYHKSLSERCLLTRGDQIKKNPSNLMIPAFHCFQFPTIFYILDAILFDTLYIIVGFTDKLVLLIITYLTVLTTFGFFRVLHLWIHFLNNCSKKYNFNSLLE